MPNYMKGSYTQIKISMSVVKKYVLSVIPNSIFNTFAKIIEFMIRCHIAQFACHSWSSELIVLTIVLIPRVFHFCMLPNKMIDRD